MASLVLQLPSGYDGDPVEIGPWEELLITQGVLEVGQMDVGDTFAMQDRCSLAEEWSFDGSRKVYVTRWEDGEIHLHDTSGNLIDDAPNFTPDGTQPFGPAHGEHSFIEEWSADLDASYYRVPPLEELEKTQQNQAPPPAPEALPEALPEAAPHAAPEAALLLAAPHAAPEAAPEALPEAAPEAAPEALPEAATLGYMLKMKLFPGARIRITHFSDATSGAFQPATVYLRRQGDPHDLVIATYDDVSLSPRFVKLELTPEFTAMMVPDMFIPDADDCPISERCVAMFPTRCSKAAEGYFYGQAYCGLDDKLLSPTTYEAVPASRARFPSTINPGMEVTLAGRTDVYVFLQFLIHVEPGQTRLYALLGNPASMLPSPTLHSRYQYRTVSLKTGTEATFEVCSPVNLCTSDVLVRLKEGAVAFLADLTAAQLKSKEFAPPPQAPLEGGEGKFDPPDLRARQPAKPPAKSDSGATPKRKKTGSPPPNVVLPSRFPYDLKNCGAKKFKTGLSIGGERFPRPSIDELKHLCSQNKLKTSGDAKALVARLLYWKTQHAKQFKGHGSESLLSSDDGEHVDSDGEEEVVRKPSKREVGKKRKADVLPGRDKRDPLSPPLSPPAPPPPELPEWKEALSSSGKVYYWNTSTREVSWVKPGSEQRPPPEPREEPLPRVQETKVKPTGQRSGQQPMQPQESSRLQLTMQPQQAMQASSSSTYAERYGMSPLSFRSECRALRNEHKMLKAELHEAIDPPIRQRLVREIVSVETRLMERGVLL